MRSEHLLIVRFSALGDVAMSVPVVASLALQYPDLRITVLSQPYARVFFEHLPGNVSFMGADIKRDYRGILGLNNLYRRLSGKRFTAVADFHDVLRTKYLRLKFGLDHIPTAHIDKHRKGRKALTARQNKCLVQQPTAFENYREVLSKLGYPIEWHFRSIFSPEENPATALPEAFIEHFKTGQTHIGIAPFAAHREKIYPLEKMEKVIDLLATDIPQLQIYLFGGGEQESRTIAEMVQRHPHCISVPQHLKGFAQELALMSLLDAMLTMDSSNMHLASLTATPVVSIWGATHPFAGFMGWNQAPEHAVGIEMACRPCSIFGNQACYRGDFACMQGIEPEVIVNKIKQILANKAR